MSFVRRLAAIAGAALAFCAPTISTAQDQPRIAATPDDELVCLAKVVLREAGSEPRDGQLAVAQVVMNRLRAPAGRFGDTICGVVGQRGQFFDVAAYRPRQDARWARALDVAQDARAGISDPVVGEALYFRPARSRSAFLDRRRVIRRIGNHVFHA